VLKFRLYHWSVLLFFLLLPACAAAAEILAAHSSPAAAALRWFVFFAVGCRLFSAGVTQAVRPDFTAGTFFGISDLRAYDLVRELGFANICFGMLGILSLPFRSLRFAAALSGGLYFLLAGIMHACQKGKNPDEWFATVTDLYAFGMLAAVSAAGFLLT